MLPEGRVKYKIVLSFFKLLENRHLQVLINKMNAALGYNFVDNIYNFL